MTQTIPPIVSELIEHNTLLHLATCKDDVPSVSLMNFSFIPPTDLAPATIVLSSKPDTQKIENIKANPRVALLIHDWTNQTQKKSENESKPALSQILHNINQAEFGRTSVTLYGSALIPDGEEAEYYRSKHLAKNPAAECFIRNADIILVVPHKAKVADFDDNVTTYDLSNELSSN